MYHDTLRLAYSRTENDSIYLNELVYRNDLLDEGFGAPAVLHASSSSGLTFDSPSLLVTRDTLRVCFDRFVLHDLANYLDLDASSDNGFSWFPLGNAGTTPGIPFRLTNSDSMLSIVHTGGSDVVATHSLDGGRTWSANSYVSNPDAYASQSPYSAADSCCTLHAGWYDFDGAPAGWYGYIFYRRSPDGGVSWEPIHSLSTAPYCEDVALAADTIRVYAVWNDCRENGSPDFALYMRISHDKGASWSPEMEVVDHIDPAREPALSIQGNLVYLVWAEQHPPDWLWGVYFMVGGWYTPGDVDRSDEVNVSDLTFFVSFLFQGGPSPILYGSADADGSGDLNVSDLTYFVAFLFAGGPPPIGAP
jgi:hypothetical protein